jgi:hypothetical protein
MTDNQMRIAIAAACPDKVEWHDELPYWNNERFALFDPLNDLNAMHEAVDTLDEKQFAVFCWTLSNMLEAFDWDRSNADLRKVMEATARLRAEAFLRTIGYLK